MKLQSRCGILAETLRRCEALQINDMNVVLGRWQLDVKQVRERVYRAPTPRERERWHAVWLLARCWSTEQVAKALERDVLTIEDWATDFEQRGSAGLNFDQSGGTPRPQSGTTSGIEGGGAGDAARSRAGTGQLELARRATLRPGALWSVAHRRRLGKV
jgi:hypothetical protein